MGQYWWPNLVTHEAKCTSEKDRNLQTGSWFLAYKSENTSIGSALMNSFMQPSMANLNSPSSRVVKDSTPFRRRILRCKNFGKGESWPSLFLDVVNLYLIKFRHRWILNERTFYSFIILFIWKWILTSNKWISLVNLYLTLFSRWWILPQLFWKRGEMMVNLDLTILLKRWTEVKTWGG